MHARPVRQRGLNRAGETLLGRGVLLLPQGLDGPRNFRIIQEGCLLQEERVGSKRNEAERCAHELKRDACSYRLARFERSCEICNILCAAPCRARVLHQPSVGMSNELPLTYARVQVGAEAVAADRPARLVGRERARSERPI